MNGDGVVGLFGNKGANWGLNMDVTNGNLGVRVGPNSTVGMMVNAASNAYGLYVYGATTYGIYTVGRSVDQKIRTYAIAGNAVNTTSTGFVDMPNMSVTINAPIGAYFQILVQVNGVQTTGSNTIGAYFRLLADGGQQDYTRQEFHNNGWELRGVTLSRILFLAAGSHTISVQWAVTSGTLTCCWYGDYRQIQVIEL